MCSPASAILASIVTILVSSKVILMSFKACGRSLLWNWLLELIFFLRLYSPAHKLWNTSKLLQNLQVLWQYLRILHLQVNTFFKYWLNTREYYHTTYKYSHNTCKYWAGEYTLRAFQNRFLLSNKVVILKGLMGVVML